jgi:SAM-dependent methyltransferase
LSAARPVLVSDVGAFAELPEDVCLKVPVGAEEEDLIFEYLALLVARPEIRRSMGVRARAWVEEHCSWRAVAEQYTRFLEEIAKPQELVAAVVGDAAIETVPDSAIIKSARGATVTNGVPAVPDSGDGLDPMPPITVDAIRSWAASPEALEYCETHNARLVHTLEMIPPGDKTKSILEMGAYVQITPLLKTRLGYSEIRGCYYGPKGRIDHKNVVSDAGERFEVLIDLFDAEKDHFPYANESFDTVLCCELLEHLFTDPMHMMSEVNRILKPGGTVLLTTPNVASLRAIAAILDGYHPGFFHAYIKPSPSGEVDARHNREYAPREIKDLLEISGFEVTRLETGEFHDEPHPEQLWVRKLLERLEFQTDLRGDGIYATGRKTGPVRERWPGWLYAS